MFSMKNWLVLDLARIEGKSASGWGDHLSPLHCYRVHYVTTWLRVYLTSRVSYKLHLVRFAIILRTVCNSWTSWRMEQKVSASSNKTWFKKNCHVLLVLRFTVSCYFVTRTQTKRLRIFLVRVSYSYTEFYKKVRLDTFSDFLNFVFNCFQNGHVNIYSWNYKIFLAQNKI